MSHYGCLDAKNTKAASVRNICSQRSEFRYFPSSAKHVPSDASLVVVHGTLRGMGDVISDAIDKNVMWAYADNGYLGKSHRLTLNATAPTTMREGRRFEYDYSEEKWRGGQGDYILVCPPSYPYMDTFKLHSWLNDMAHTINCHTGRNIIVRAKPAKPIRADKAQPLDDVLENAYAVVTWGSAVAQQAMLKGIPTISTGWCPVKGASFNLEDLETDKLLIEPDRRAIMDNLTWCSFDKEEMPTALDIAKDNSKCKPL